MIAYYTVNPPAMGVVELHNPNLLYKGIYILDLRDDLSRLPVLHRRFNGSALVC